MDIVRLFYPLKTFPVFILILGLFCTSTNSSFANVDTIYAGIPVGQIGSSCVDLANFPGEITSISNLCPDSSGINATFTMQDFSNGCIYYVGLAEGSSLGCFEICDDQSNCDTLLIYLNTDPIIPTNFMCDTLIIPEFLNISISDCGAQANVCLPIRFDLLNSLEIYDNGVLYANGMTGCDIDTTVAYTYSNLFGQGVTGPYLLESWFINGDEYMGEFADINALLDSMNVWDTLGVWAFDTIVPFTILGGFSDNFYGPVIASRPGVINSTSIMGANYGLTPLGSQITLAQGQHLIEIVDNNTACTDSININIVCLPNDSLNLQTYLNISGSICIDTSDLVGNFTSLENACDDSGIGVDIFPDDVCVDWETLLEGTQQICLVACDDLGFCDTTFITYDVIDPKTDTLDIILAENDSEYLCIDSTELIGAINIYSVAVPGITTQIVLDSIDYCLEIMSTTEGNEIVCVQICDDQGGCDTTCFNITVNNTAAGLPQANDDSDTTNFETILTLDLTVNDTLMPNDTIRLVSGPLSGMVVIDSAGIASYTPNDGFCGNDAFTYEICNSIGCDQATVSILVTCDAVNVYNGFSPNGDNVNDTFMITGLEGFPNHKVYVFNRWGNMVFEAEDYKGTWEGVWEGNRLPEGSYFYVVDLNDDLNTKLSGLVYIAN